MILVDRQIREFCTMGLVTPYDESLVNPSSIDVRLGSKLLIDATGCFEEVDISQTNREKPFYIPPNGFLLGMTYEYFYVPANLALELKLKSSRARERLSHSLAGWVDNGFNGCLTLELKNYSDKNPVPIYYMQRIGQAILHATSEPDNCYQGKYSGYVRPIASLDLED